MPTITRGCNQGIGKTICQCLTFCRALHLAFNTAAFLVQLIKACGNVCCFLGIVRAQQTRGQVTVSHSAARVEARPKIKAHIFSNWLSLDPAQTFQRCETWIVPFSHFDKALSHKCSVYPLQRHDISDGSQCHHVKKLQ